MVYTSEDKLADLARSGNAKRYVGERARCHEIPATQGNRSTVFDRWPGNVEKAAREKWAREEMGRLRVACEEQHGTAIDAFVLDVIERGEITVRKLLDKRMDGFLAAVQPTTLAPEVAHAARNFALLYAGGGSRDRSRCVALEQARAAMGNSENLQVSLSPRLWTG